MRIKANSKFVLLFVLSYISVLSWNHLIGLMEFQGKYIGVSSTGFNPILFLLFFVDYYLLKFML